MKTYYKFKSVWVLCAFIAFFSSCKKKEMAMEPELISNHNNKAWAGDEKWDLLGYGYDVTGEYLELSSASSAPVLNMERFEKDYRNKINAPTTGSNYENYFYGASAYNYVRDINKKKSFNASVTGGEKIISEDNKSYFTGSITTKNSSENKLEFNSKYSYATFESVKSIKKIQFTPDVTLDLLKNYLTADFVEHIRTQSAQTLVAWYGTHVLLDITLGGRLSFDYYASVANQTNSETRTSEIEGGLGVFVKKFGININTTKSQTEMTKSFNEAASRQFGLHYKGGSNSGKSVSFDSNGNTSETVNIAAWQSSVVPANCALVGIDRMVPLYEFITDPVKKSQVMAAIEKHIADKQITIVKDLSEGSIPFYNHHKYSDGTGHYISSNANEAGWVPDGIAFRAFTTQRPGTQPIYEFWGQKNNKTYYYYQTGSSQTSFWHLTGIKFFAYPDQVQGTIPVYGYMNRFGEDHYFSTDNISGTYWVTKWPAFSVFPAKQE